jgi:hypothetical protein
MTLEKRKMIMVGLRIRRAEEDEEEEKRKYRTKEIHGDKAGQSPQTPEG